jgi:LGFP repeat
MTVRVSRSPWAVNRVREGNVTMIGRTLDRSAGWRLVVGVILTLGAGSAACGTAPPAGEEVDELEESQHELGGLLPPPLRIIPDFDGFQATHPWVGRKLGGVISINGQVFAQEFEGASAYGPIFASAAGVHEIHGAIRDRYRAPGNPDGWLLLGYPTTDETATADGVGRYNHFERGSIFWHPQTGAHEVHGAIRDLWAQLGWERSELGYPTSDEAPLDGGARRSRFQHGSIYWTPGFGAVALFENLQGPASGDRLPEIGHDGLVWYVSFLDEHVQSLDQILRDDGWLAKGIREYGGEEALYWLRRANWNIQTINAIGGHHGVDVQGVLGRSGVIITPRGFGLYQDLVKAARVAVSGANILEFILGSAAMSPAVSAAFGVGMAAEVYRLMLAGNPWTVAFAIAAVDWVLGGDSDPDEHGGVHADRGEVGPWETFSLGQVNDSGEVALLSWQGFLSARSGGGGNVYGNRPQVGEWERWRLIDNHDGTISLQTHDQHYLKAIGGGDSYCQANGEGVGPWERFFLVPLPGGRVALKTQMKEKYVSVQPGL